MYRRLKKCLLFVALFALFLTSFFTVYSNRAFANYQPIPENWTTCESSPTEKKWRNNTDDEANKTLWQAMFDADQTAYGKMRSAKTMILISRSDGQSNNYFTIAWSNDDDVELQAYRRLTSPNRYAFGWTWPSGSGTYHTWQSNPSNKLVAPPSESSVSNDDLRIIAEPFNTDRVCNAKNLTFDSTWPSELQIMPNGGQPPVQNPTKGCSALDLPCWFSTVFNGFTDTLQSVAEAILSGITYLFVPDGELIAMSLESMKEFFEQKLGFLVYPITWFVDLLNGLVNLIANDSTNGTGICNQTISNNPPSLPGVIGSDFFGSPVRLNFCSIPSGISTAMRLLAQAGLAFVLIQLFRTKLSEVMEK